MEPKFDKSMPAADFIELVTGFKLTNAQREWFRLVEQDGPLVVSRQLTIRLRKCICCSTGFVPSGRGDDTCDSCLDEQR